MKTFLMRVLTPCCVVMLFVSTATAEESLTEAKRADIMRLLQVTGSGQVGLQFGDLMVQGITESLKTVRQDFPPRLTEIIREEVMKLLQQRLGGMLEMLVPVYHQNLTHEEVKGLLQFYGTPLGKKLIQTLPVIMKQSTVVGQTWGQSLGPLIEERLRARFAAEGFK
jgi:hypothetical protein